MKTILLLGDSLLADFDWQVRMPSYRLINLAVPGARTADLSASLPTVRQQVPTADIIMVMIGTNDLLSGDLDFIARLKKILVRLSLDFPSAEIVVNSLLPMQLAHLPGETIAALNGQIEAFSMQTGCCYLNIHRRFAESKQPIFQEDGVHLLHAAYEIWARSLLEHIAFLLEND